MDLGLRDRAYVLTGASRGLGYATAEHLVRDGANVVISSRDQGAVEAAVERLAHLGGGTALGAVADLADEDTPDRLLAAAGRAFGRVDGVVISVGGPPATSVAEATDEQWRQAFDSVFLGAVRMARAVLTHATDPVAVTWVLSTSVRAPLAGMAISNGLRPGLAMVTKTLADEHGPDGHRVNAVLPGRFAAERVARLEAAAEDPEAVRARLQAAIPLRRYGRPEEFGAVAAFVTSPAASYVTGSVIAVDGGSTRAL